VLGPISAADYAALPNKGQEGRPTSYFFSLLSTPTVTVWPTPDDANTYTLKMQTFRQLQDVDLSSGSGFDSPYRFLDCITTGLAARLAEFYRPEKADKLNTLYERRFALAQKRDQENVNLKIQPNIGIYYR
jgi:hypothetical protein